ncbi:Gfo/Idh/MocA family protein [Mesorhizobium sp. A623]
MSAPVRVGVIGLGEVGQHHVKGLLNGTNAVLAAVADISETLRGKTAEATGARAYASDVELLEDASIDAVVICVPHKFHADIAIRALAKGKHVLVEKPMAVSVAECDAMIAAAKTADKLLGVSHNQLFYPAHEWLRTQISSKAIERPSSVRLRLAIGGKLGGWRADPDLTGGGLLFDAGFHRFYVARSLMGEVESVTATLDTTDPRGIGEDRAAVTLAFRDGGQAIIEAGYHAPKGVFDDQIEVVSPSAMIRVPGIEAHFEKFTSEPDVLVWKGGKWSAVEVESIDWSATVGRSVQNFVAAIRGDEALRVDGEDGRRVVALLEATYRSAIEGKRIVLA